jgi:UDP-N-acetyl-D-mannosaminuronic acid dehydrogenase
MNVVYKNMIYKVSVVGGAGHIGLPLSCYISFHGHQVSIIDSNKNVIDNLQNNKLPFEEVNLAKYWESAVKNDIFLTTKLDNIVNSDFIIITLGTSSEIEDINLFNNLMDQIISIASFGAKIILRSTINFETIEKIESNDTFIKNELKIAYCPERIAEGLSLKELPEMPQIIGTSNKEDYQKFSDFFETLNIKSIQTSIQNAVFLKLFTNTYRYAEFSLLNEFYNVAKDNNINFDEVIDIAKTDYPRLKNIPSRGFVGGPCLIKDTKTFIKEYGEGSKVLTSIQNTNSIYFENILDECKKIFVGNEIIQLGLAFKPSSDDIRASLSLDFYNYLIDNGFKVYPVDRYVNQEDLDFQIYDYDAVKLKTDNILISTFHEYFNEIDFNQKRVVTVGNN